MTDEVLEDRIREVFARQLALLDDHVEEATESAPALAPRATTRSAKRSCFWAAAGVTVAAGIVLLVGALIMGTRDTDSLINAGPVQTGVDDPERVVVSPYVDIEARLVQQTDVQLFTVTSNRPSYWRLAALDIFQDNIWKVAGYFSPVTGRLPGQSDQAGQHDEIRQDYSIDALDAIWLPAAFAPSELVAATAEITWNEETSSLTVTNEVQTSDGVDYSLISLMPRITPEQLRGASNFVPQNMAEQNLTLPPLPPIVQEEAARVTADALTRYDQLLALQDYFRGFDYSLELTARIGDPTEQFLRERVGSSQHFAGTFALMARQLGIPARVAIGFTWGDPTGQAEDGRTIYRVTGRQSHAWPEAWFDGVGWVAFEPTPGRGAPAAVDYTQVPAAQDSLIQPENP